MEYTSFRNSRKGLTKQTLITTSFFSIGSLSALPTFSKSLLEDDFDGLKRNFN